MTLGLIIDAEVTHRRLPLVVDLDGTLTPTDTLVESLVALATKSPWMLVYVPLWIVKGRAGFKESVAAHAGISAIRLPFRESFVTFLRGEKINGRIIILATAAHRSIAMEVSGYLGLFDEVLATEGDHNLKGKAKLAAIEERFGSEFVYAGDSKADIPVWKAAKAAILVGVSQAVSESIRKSVPIEREFTKEVCGLADWLKILRGQPWQVNILLFVPLLTSLLPIEVDKLSRVCVVFMAFGLATSAVCLLNEIRMLDFDRSNMGSRFRPFASGQLPLLHGLFAAAGALMIASVVAFIISRGFFLLLLVQIALTSGCLFRNRHVLIDAIAEMLLCTFCVLTGSIAVDTPSAAVLPFFACILFALALLRHWSRTAGSDGMPTATNTHHRMNSLSVVRTCSMGALIFAATFVGLYVASSETRENSATPQLLRLLAVGIIFCLAGRWLKSP